MTWFDKSQSPKVKAAVFQEKERAERPVPSWIAEQTEMRPRWVKGRTQAPPPPAPKTSPPPAPSRGTREAAAHERREPASGVQPIPAAVPATVVAAAPGSSIFPPAGAAEPVLVERAPFPIAETVPLSHALQDATDERLEGALASLDSAAAQLLDWAGAERAVIERAVIDLATAIARRVLSREVRTDPSIVAALAAEGIDALGARDRIVVRVGPVSPELLADWRHRLRARAPRAELTMDEKLPEGACIVESELGRVDESIEARLDAVLGVLAPPNDPASPSSNASPSSEQPLSRPRP